MSTLFYFLLSPLILLISIPLTIFAAFTTSLAFFTLFIRVLIIYAELAAAIIQDNFSNNTSPTYFTSTTSSASHSKANLRKSRRSSAASGSSNGSTTPKVPKTSGMGVFGGDGPASDFDGVGGWRAAGPDGEDELWTSLNYRLELPAVGDGGRRHHHRSRTSGSLHNYQRQLLIRDVSQAGYPRGLNGIVGEELMYCTKSRPTTALDAALTGKGWPRTQPSGSSSVSSQSSPRTINLNLTSK